MTSSLLSSNTHIQGFSVRRYCAARNTNFAQVSHPPKRRAYFDDIAQYTVEGLLCGLRHFVFG
jgi:hypothetical protein